jgi:hypothetical protein
VVVDREKERKEEEEFKAKLVKKTKWFFFSLYNFKCILLTIQ